MPSEFLFNQQDEAYQRSVLNNRDKTIAIEMGATIGWYKYASRVSVSTHSVFLLLQKF